MKFTMTISMNETTIAANKDMLRQSVATKFNTAIEKVFVRVVKASVRRILNTETRLEVEIIDIQPDDVKAYTDVLENESFEANLAAIIQENTNIAVTISSVTDPSITAMVPPSKPSTTDKDDGSSGGAAGAIAAVLSVLFCCACAGGIYYLYTQQDNVKWEGEDEGTEMATGETTAGNWES